MSDLTQNPLRKCNRCLVEKAPSEFGKFHRGPDGLNRRCKVCCKEQGVAWRAANSEKERARCSAWRKANPDKRKEVTKAYRDDNKQKLREQELARYYKDPEATKQRSRDSYERNKESIARRNAEWSGRNPDKVNAKGRAWAARNPDKVRSKCARRRARMRVMPWAVESAILKLYAKARKLERETGVAHEVDHIYPLTSRHVCGLHVAENLQVIPASVNRRKKNLLPGALSHELWAPAGPDVFHGGVA